MVLIEYLSDKLNERRILNKEYLCVRLAPRKVVLLGLEKNKLDLQKSVKLIQYSNSGLWFKAFA